MLQLHWSESENDVAWNALLVYYAVYLYWSESDYAWKLGCNPFWSDVASDVSLSLSLQYNCTLRVWAIQVDANNFRRSESNKIS